MSALIAVLHLHLSIARDLLEGKVALYADKPFALSMAVDSRSSEDVNLGLYEILGRVCLFGLWKHWLAETDAEGEDREQEIELRDQSLQMAFGMINANPGLMSPIRDDFAIEIGLLLMLVEKCGRVDDV